VAVFLAAASPAPVARMSVAGARHATIFAKGGGFASTASGRGLLRFDVSSIPAK
jgi:hypothetical protein